MRRNTRVRGSWNFINIFISGLSTLIAFNYLAIGFGDVVDSIDRILAWLQQNDIDIYRIVSHLLK